jgi:RHS repeat-associated protein
VDGWLSRTEGATSRQFLTDALGSVIAITDSSGTLKTQYTYEPYGRTTSTGEVSSNPYQYTGRENDGTGLYYYRARYYNPALQRFISSDPIGLSGGMNSYEYVGGNPLSFTDPSGTCIFGLLSCGAEFGVGLDGGLGPVGASSHSGIGGGYFPKTGSVPKGYIVSGRVQDGVLQGPQPNSEGLGLNSNCNLKWKRLDYYSPLLKQKGPLVSGASPSVGTSVWLSNAQNVEDLSGAFDTRTFTSPIVSISESKGLNSQGNEIAVYGVSFGPMGFSPGVSATGYATNTVTLDQINDCRSRRAQK